MGVFDVLEKGVKIGVKGLGVVAELGNRAANDIDRMSDEEIERKFSKSADEMRAQADYMHSIYDQYQMRKEINQYEDDDE